jgi:transcriptional regulator with XRE-family HTH domain
VRSRRLTLGLSQEELARRASCDRQTINRLEQAHHSASLDQWFLVAAALGVSLADLIDQSEPHG